MSSSVFQVSLRKPGMSGLGGVLRVTVVLVFIFIALFLGLLPPLLGLDSALLVGGIVLILLALVLFSVVVIGALNGREWPLIAFLCFSVFLIDASFRQRELTAQSMDWQTLMKLVVWGFSLLIALVVTPNFFKRLFHGDMKWLSMLSLLAVCSSTYSLTPAYTFGGGVAMVSYCALAVCVVERLNKEQILLGFLAGLVLMLVVSLLMYAMGGGMAVMEGGAVLRLGGLAGSPNSLGRAASLTLLLIGVLLIYGHISLWDWRCWLPTGLAVVCLVLADSRTSIAVVLVAFALYFLRRRPVVALLACLFGGLVGVVLLNANMSLNDFAAAFSRTGRTSDLTTLTGRTDIWSVVIPAFLQQPILGYGFGATKILLPEIYRTPWGFTVTHAHNLYLQTAISLGLVGLFFVVMILVRQIASYFSRQDVLKTVVLGFILVHGLTEPGPIGVTPNVVTFFWALSLCWDRVLEREALSRQGVSNGITEAERRRGK